MSASNFSDSFWQDVGYTIDDAVQSPDEKHPYASDHVMSKTDIAFYYNKGMLEIVNDKRNWILFQATRDNMSQTTAFYFVNKFTHNEQKRVMTQEWIDELNYDQYKQLTLSKTLEHFDALITAFKDIPAYMNAQVDSFETYVKYQKPYLSDYVSTPTFTGDQNDYFANWSRKLPAMEKEVECPLFGQEIKGWAGDLFPCNTGKTHLWRMIQHLNDHHKMSREEIAGWVRTLPFDTTFKGMEKDNDND